MKKPTFFVVAPIVAAVYGPPLFQVVVQVIDGGKVTQKLPPSIALQVLSTASANSDTGPIVRPVADLMLSKMIRMPQPEKPGQVQLPVKGVSDTGSTDTG